MSVTPSSFYFSYATKPPGPDKNDPDEVIKGQEPGPDKNDPDEVIKDQKPDLEKEQGDSDTCASEKNKSAGIIIAEKITEDHTSHSRCGKYSKKYDEKEQVGYDGFHSADIAEILFFEIYNNPKIMNLIEEDKYYPTNAVFAFTGHIESSIDSCITCRECELTEEPICQSDRTVKSVCFVGSGTPGKFFTKSCPNLVNKSDSKEEITVRQVAPLILIKNISYEDRSEYDQMLDKEGNTTGAHYTDLLAYIENDGNITSDCADDNRCLEFVEIMKEVGWYSGKMLTIKPSEEEVSSDTSSYSVYPSESELF
ncbi:hypothetical protein [Wolbachia endosymbiont of Ctenocephalides felis wCfeT]|uniref:hypothetical protein n=1 Tax=Wolbachia endosymbiont of Ctenocephalides felis wCfeT TaxID=2732593 RepID=UPI001447A08A|nr:hypothetical protein [Wolbachia endosymbiont of Ctenocephalides felis wCfeT]